MQWEETPDTQLYTHPPERGEDRVIRTSYVDRVVENVARAKVIRDREEAAVFERMCNRIPAPPPIDPRYENWSG